MQIQRLTIALTFGLISLPLCGQLYAQEQDLQAYFNAPIEIERGEEPTILPLDIRMNKLFIQAEIMGQSGEFIFDTGSPTILTRAFAETLDLEIIGENIGRDANGNPVRMDVALVETLKLGETIFKNVPVFIYDYANIDMGDCFFQGGVIGSEILPGSVWTLNTRDQILTLQAQSADREGATHPLHDFGYPHAPIVDYRIGDVNDKALFDTGSARAISLFSRVADTPSVHGDIQRGSVRLGEGYEGVSAGGRGNVTPLVRMTLEHFYLDDTDLGPLPAQTRSIPPSLIGYGLLDYYQITLDYPAGAMVLSAHDGPRADPPSPSFGVAYVGEEAQIVQLFSNSRAAETGLKLHDHVIAINDHPLEHDSFEARCEAARWLAQDFDPNDETTLIVEREGTRETVLIPAQN
ncbi:aspartyl protease family protein [Woodsholea maritima]|uniref:aspartyl protease family protein n=1 Tax=Woodsholea maritima TaxID=240237 RepID=UPI0003799340|nr:aspartyl protease family protein [Woodsholea maritima]